MTHLVFACGTQARVAGMLALPSYTRRPEDPPTDAVNGRAVRCRWVDAHRVFPGFYGYWVEPRCILEDRGKGLYLPAFFCAALLLSDQPIRGAMADGSGVVIAWFQDGLEPFLGEDIRREARREWWEHIANNYDIGRPEPEVEEDEQPRVPRHSG